MGTPLHDFASLGESSSPGVRGVLSEEVWSVRLTQETAGGIMKQAKKRDQEIFDRLVSR
jgi:hypothetical protein